MANLRDANNAKIELIYKLNLAVGSAWDARVVAIKRERSWLAQPHSRSQRIRAGRPGKSLHAADWNRIADRHARIAKPKGIAAREVELGVHNIDTVGIVNIKRDKAGFEK